MTLQSAHPTSVHAPVLLPEALGPRAAINPLLGRGNGTDLCFWYHATNIARASACCRYRIGNLTELLRGASAVIDGVLPDPALRGKSVVIVSRPCVDGPRARALEALRRRGIRLVADFDDLLFDCPPEEFPPILQGSSQRAVHERRLQGYRESLQFFDAFTVATEPLAEHVRACRPGAPVHVVPNGLSPSWLRQGQLLYRAWQPGDPKVIRYLPGSPSHDADFAFIREPLQAFLHEHREVQLEIVGPLAFDESGFPADRLTRHPKVPFEHLGHLLASSWATLAPLVPTEFNRCKSAIKFLEAAAFGCPTLATPSADMMRHGAGGVRLIETAEGWYRGLVELLDDERRMAVGSQSRQYVSVHGTARTSVEALQLAKSSWDVN